MKKEMVLDVRGRFEPDAQSFKVIVFDCDGVLFDSKEANVRFYNLILGEMGLPPVREDQVEYIHMHSAGESLKFLVGNGSAYEAAMRYCRNVDFRRFNAYLHREPGIRALLEALKPRYKIALATNRTVSTGEVLSHFLLDKYFDLVVTALDVEFPKPHPAEMERILENFGVEPRDVLYVGDSAVDEALAEATGVFFTAYKNPGLKADLHIDHFRELCAFLSPGEPSEGGSGIL